MINYNEFRFYSPQLDAEAARLSIADERGQEFFAIVRADDAKRYREARDTALESIVSAIHSGHAPGQVYIQ